MGVIQKVFANYGFGGLIGGVVGGAVFEEFASKSNCGGVMIEALCLELLGMTAAQFISGCAALGGFILLVYQVVKGEFL